MAIMTFHYYNIPQMRRSNYYKLFTFGFLAFFSFLNQTSAQVSTEGKDFWLTFLPHPIPDDDNFDIYKPQTIFIFLSTKEAANVTIDFPSGPNQTVVMPANSTQKIQVPVVDSVTPSGMIVETKGVRIISDVNISVYTLNKWNSVSADATIILPNFALGKEYYVVSELIDPNPSVNDYESVACIVAIEDDTEIEITPTQNLSDGKPANVTFIQTLDAGETYMIKSYTDLSGTRIATVSSADNGCKNFAVFSGTERTSVGSGCGGGGFDHLSSSFIR